MSRRNIAENNSEVLTMLVEIESHTIVNPDFVF